MCRREFLHDLEPLIRFAASQKREEKLNKGYVALKHSMKAFADGSGDSEVEMKRAIDPTQLMPVSRQQLVPYIEKRLIALRALERALLKANKCLSDAKKSAWTLQCFMPGERRRIDYGHSHLHGYAERASGNDA